ncbi:unnamed protein product [Gadus morhua 'NCC']
MEIRGCATDRGCDDGDVPRVFVHFFKTNSPAQLDRSRNHHHRGGQRPAVSYRVLERGAPAKVLAIWDLLL